MSEQNDVDFLGALPLDMRIREETDSGKPTVVAEPDGRIAQIYREIARRTGGEAVAEDQGLRGALPADRDLQRLGIYSGGAIRR